MFTPAGYGRSNGRRAGSSSAAVRARNVAVTVCRPALTGTRTRQSASARLRAARPSRRELEALHDLADRRRVRVVVRGLRRHQRHGRQREQRDALAVDGDLELLLLGVERHLLVQVARELGRDLVLGVGREVVLDQRAAARAERQAGQAPLLRAVVGHAEPIDVHELRRRADREPADLVGRREVALEQRRRQLQHAGDVVEAVARLVGRQQLGDLDVEVEQVADRVAVLGAVQAVERLGAARVRVGGGRGVELALEPAASASRASVAGRGSPTGGIMPARSLRTTASHSAGCAATSPSGSDFRLKSAVRSMSSWQLVQ